MKVRLALLTNACSAGGCEHHLLDLVAGLDKEKYQIFLIFFWESAEVSRSLVGDFKAHGVEVLDLKARSRWDLGAWRRLILALRKERCHILHTHLWYASVVGALIQRLARIPKHLATVHSLDGIMGFDERPQVKPLRSWLARRAYSTVDRVIVISDALGKSLRDTLGIDPRQIVRIHYGLGPTPSSNGKAKVLEDLDGGNGPHLGVVARLITRKGLAYLIKALVKVIRIHPQTRLWVIGPDEHGLGQELRELVQSLGLGSHVEFLGFRADIPQLLRQIDVFILPSFHEGFGLVLLEAMREGKPIVATAVGPIPEIVLDGVTGFLVPPRDSEDLADRILTLLNDGDLRKRMGEAGKKRWNENFTIETMVRSTEAIYETLSPSGVEIPGESA